MNSATRALVRRRAANRCEYCRLSQQDLVTLTFHIEHVIARQHQGSDDPANLALACDRCNFHKGPNLSAIDPVSGKTASIFNPRKQQWDEHFRLDDSRVIGLTPIGRATVRLLNMNAARRVQLRKDAQERG